jgi:hypothetical protein
MHLDAKGLVALWRESLLAKAVLEKKTSAYSNHPQLYRFKEQESPIEFINTYLEEVYKEAKRRGYNFDHTKIANDKTARKIYLTTKQLDYEKQHLLKKLEKRNLIKFEEERDKKFLPHPIFELVEGEIESWEVIKINL